MDIENQNSIIGSGFISKNFEKYHEFFKKLSIKLYAAGVSNSLCNDKSLFKKDKDKIIDFSKKIPKNQTLLYFSTCSVYDPSRNNNLYVKHKLNIENFIKDNFQKFLIVRLPEVVGKNSNEHTLVNFFYNKIKNKDKFDLWSNANRSIIDIEDVVKILIDFISNADTKKNRIINIANPKKSSAMHIVYILENLTGTKAKYNLITKGEKNWKIDIESTEVSMKKLNITFGKNYLENVLKKYFS
tara:strand:+ start:241 stop:966 length:726 start_codon:yes stop_codon:yes gene_type:complete